MRRLWVRTLSVRPMLNFSDKLKEKENLKSQNIGARHPKMLALLETERILGDKLNKELIGLRSSLKSKLEMVAASRKHWEATVAQKRGRSSEARPAGSHV